MKIKTKFARSDIFGWFPAVVTIFLILILFSVAVLSLKLTTKTANIDLVAPSFTSYQDTNLNFVFFFIEGPLRDKTSTFNLIYLDDRNGLQDYFDYFIGSFLPDATHYAFIYRNFIIGKPDFTLIPANSFNRYETLGNNFPVFEAGNYEVASVEDSSTIKYDFEKYIGSFLNFYPSNQEVDRVIAGFIKNKFQVVQR